MKSNWSPLRKPVMAAVSLMKEVNVKKWLVSLAMMVVLVSGPMGLATSSQTANQHIVYGEANYGLKIGGWFDAPNHRIYCRIKNDQNLSIRYCHSLVGNDEFVLLYARQTPQDIWKLIPLKSNPRRSYIGGILPRERNKLLHANQVMPPGPYGWRLSREPNFKYTFYVPLNSFDFPGDWIGEIECRVKQIMCNPKVDDSGEDRSLKTNVIKVVLPLETKQQKTD